MSDMPRTPHTHQKCCQGLCRALLITSLWLGLSACAGITPVQPWEKGVLAKPAMAFEGDRLDSNFVEHTYASKEAAAGGAGVGGGGCVCN